MRCIEIIEQPYCVGCPMSQFKIIGNSAVCDNAFLCDRLYHWLKDGETSPTERPAVDEDEDEDEDEEEKLYLWDDSEYSFSDDVKYDDIKDLI